MWMAKKCMRNANYKGFTTIWKYFYPRHSHSPSSWPMSNKRELYLGLSMPKLTTEEILKKLESGAYVNLSSNTPSLYTNLLTAIYLALFNRWRHWPWWCSSNCRGTQDQSNYYQIKFIPYATNYFAFSSSDTNIHIKYTYKIYI